MLGRNLIDVFILMRDAGLTGSKRDYATRWLGRGKTYFRDYEHRPERLNLPVADRTVACLRRRLIAVASFTSRSVAVRIDGILTEIDSACRFSEFICRGR